MNDVKKKRHTHSSVESYTHFSVENYTHYSKELHKHEEEKSGVLCLFAHLNFNQYTQCFGIIISP